MSKTKMRFFFSLQQPLQLTATTIATPLQQNSDTAITRAGFK